MACCVMRSRLLVPVLLLGLTAPLTAQGPPSGLYLPIDSWTTPYVEHLIRAGVLRGLDALTRPLKRADVARAVARVDTTNLPHSVNSNLQLLAWELEERPDTVRWKVEASVGLQGASDASRWTVRPEPENTGVFYQGGLTGSFEFPHVGIVTSPYFDTRLRRDDQFTGNKQRFIAGDNAEAYVLASWKYSGVFFGSEPRNWGPPEVEGLLLSPSPYPYDHFMIRLGPRRFRLELLATQLDNMPALYNDSLPAKRFLSVHRLVIEPSDRLSFSLSEAVLYTDSGAPSRDLEPWFLNPVNLWVLFQENFVSRANSLVGADFSYRLNGELGIAGQLYADDFRLSRNTIGEPPEELGYTLSLTGGALRGEASWSLFYTRVDYFDYRTRSRAEQYTVRGVGLARDHDDYDQWTGKVTVASLPRALVTAELTYLRQGQGDPRKPLPPESLWGGPNQDSLTFLPGIVERTLRVAAQAAWTPAPGWNLSAEVGRHFVWNANHVRGIRGDRWVCRVRLEIRRRVMGALNW